MNKEEICLDTIRGGVALHGVSLLANLDKPDTFYLDISMFSGGRSGEYFKDMPLPNGILPSSGKERYLAEKKIREHIFEIIAEEFSAIDEKLKKRITDYLEGLI